MQYKIKINISPQKDISSCENRFKQLYSQRDDNTLPTLNEDPTRLDVQQIIDHTKIMQEELINLLQLQKTKKKENEIINSFFKMLQWTNWKSDFRNYISFLQHYIELFAVVFPSMIAKDLCYPLRNYREQSVRKYWKLASKHETIIKQDISEFYEQLYDNKFKDSVKDSNDVNVNEPNTATFLGETVIPKNKKIYEFSQNTPIVVNESNDETKQEVSRLYIYYFLRVLTNYTGGRHQVPMSRLIYNFLTMMKKTYDMINLSCATISYEIEKLHKNERAEITNNLKNLSLDKKILHKLQKKEGLKRLKMDLKKYSKNLFTFHLQKKKNTEKVANQNL
jgi:hypothetical protein